MRHWVKVLFTFTRYQETQKTKTSKQTVQVISACELLVDARHTSCSVASTRESDLRVPASLRPPDSLPRIPLMALPSPSWRAPHISAPSADRLKGMGAIVDPGVLSPL